MPWNLWRRSDSFGRRLTFHTAMSVAAACVVILMWQHPASAQGVPVPPEQSLPATVPMPVRPLPVAPLPASPLPSAGPRVAPVTPRVLLVPADSARDDSLRVIIERDFTFSDQLEVIVLDAASSSVLAAMSDDTLYNEAARFGAAYVLRLVRIPTGVRATVLDIHKRRVVHTANVRIGWDSLGAAPRMDMHRMADLAQGWITGTRGIAATRVAYVLNNVIHIIDSDGVGDTAVTSHGVSLSPAWDPRGTSLVYTDLSDAGSQIIRLDLLRGRTQLFSATKRGLNITPVFTPAGDSVVYATASLRGSRLVISSATGKGKARPLRIQFATELRDMAAPVFSPNGKQLAFVASRPSYPQIYTMNVNGTHVQRLVPPSATLRNERTAPAWSPNGATIIYQQQNRKFQIWVAHLKGGVADTVTRITSQGENEDPSWGPDSRHVVLTSNRGGEKQLWIVDLISGHWRQLTTSVGARLASWSPRLARMDAARSR